MMHCVGILPQLKNNLKVATGFLLGVILAQLCTNHRIAHFKVNCVACGWYLIELSLVFQTTFLIPVKADTILT